MTQTSTGRGSPAFLCAVLRCKKLDPQIALRFSQRTLGAYGLNPTLCHNSAVRYIVPLVITYSTLRVF